MWTKGFLERGGGTLLEEPRKQGRVGFRQENTEGEEIRTDRKKCQQHREGESLNFSSKVCKWGVRVAQGYIGVKCQKTTAFFPRHQQ